MKKKGTVMTTSNNLDDKIHMVCSTTELFLQYIPEAAGQTVLTDLVAQAFHRLRYGCGARYGSGANIWRRYGTV